GRAGIAGINTGVEFGGERGFNGEADANQSNSLTGSITVTVADVLPNGLLGVRGEKWITLNNGDELIRLSGLIRPEDVGPDNSVLSIRIADARSTYSGTGAFANASKPRRASQFFMSPVWPFQDPGVIPAHIADLSLPGPGKSVGAGRTPEGYRQHRRYPQQPADRLRPRGRSGWVR